MLLPSTETGDAVLGKRVSYLGESKDLRVSDVLGTTGTESAGAVAFQQVGKIVPTEMPEGEGN